MTRIISSDRIIDVIGNVFNDHNAQTGEIQFIKKDLKRCESVLNRLPMAAK